MAKRVKFIPFEIQAILADADFQIMDAEQRGVYLSLILYMYANGGKCLLDMQYLSQLTRCDDFENVWQIIKKKFQEKGGYIKHKRVSNELRRAKKLMQDKRKSGLKGAKERWHSHSTPIGSANSTAMANENENNNKNKNNNENKKENKNTRGYKRNVIGEGEEKTSYTNTNSSYEFARPNSSITPRTRPARCEGPAGSDRRGGPPVRLDKCLRIGTMGKNQSGNSDQ